MKKILFIAAGVLCILACVLANGVDIATEDSKLIKKITNSPATIDKTLEITGEIRVISDTNQPVRKIKEVCTNKISEVKKVKKPRRKRGKKNRRLFIDKDGDGVADDRNL